MDQASSPTDAVDAPMPVEASSAHDLTSQFGASALEELRQLGVQTFQASELENTVMRQMDEKLEQEAAYRTSRELNKMKAALDELRIQIARLKAQCQRLSQQDQADPDVKELYKECFGAYRKKKAEAEDLEKTTKNLMLALDARVVADRLARAEQESLHQDKYAFDLGMRTTTTEEQEVALAARRSASQEPLEGHQAESTMEYTMDTSPSSLILDAEAEMTPNRPTEPRKRKRPQRSPSQSDSEEPTSPTTTSRKRTYFGEEADTELPPQPRAAPSRTASAPPKATTARAAMDDEDYEDDVDALLDEFQAPRGDNEEAEAAEALGDPDVEHQRVRRTALGDLGDESPDVYVARIEKWILEHKDDPRSHEIRKLRRWLEVKNKASTKGTAKLTDKEKAVLQKGLPQRKVSVSRNDEIATTKYEGGFQLPKHLYKKLFEHQRVAVRWLWELHQQEAGGILGDEMGLGKTLETIAFLSGLVNSGLMTGPVLIVCPTTVMSHWIREFHWWAPEFSVMTYRGSGDAVPISPTLERCADVYNQPNGFTQIYDDLWHEIEQTLQEKQKEKPRASKPRRAKKAAAPERGAKKTRRGKEQADAIILDSSDEEGQEAENVDIMDVDGDAETVVAPIAANDEENLLDDVLGERRRCQKPPVDETEEAIFESVDAHTPVVLIVSYETVRMNIAALVRVHWHYAIMDEGHKLRNPEAAVTQACKRLPTPHRMLLTGTPIQNNLVELWSLFDFCFPGKLGTLETFEKHFAWPIQRGGYATASPMEVRVAYKCAVTLRDLVNPYLLRRSKDQVNIHLPEKSEQILFCQLTEKQRADYKAFLRSADATAVYEGLKNMLFGVDMLRKICNHSFLLEQDHGAYNLSQVETLQDLTEGSAKLKVLNHILALWKQQGHRVLLFTQTVQMLNIVQAFVSMLGYNFLRMDGTTASKHRQQLVDRFNEANPADPDCPYIFLLTTRVGGLGINLTSANRVIVYDPDWNPMTDLQAKERAYRIGQTSSVIVYRLVTSGTIEEKIYHRQVFKQFLTQKILRDPKQTRSFFQSSGLKELFKLSDKPGALHEDALTQIPREETANDEDDQQAKDGEDGWLLTGLMGQEVTAKVDHDAVIDSETGHRGKKNTVEAYIDYEAENLASKAVEMLRRSRASADALSSTQASARVGDRPTPRFGTVSRNSSAVASSSATPSPLQKRVSGLGATTTKVGMSGQELLESLRENSVHPLVETQAQLVRLKDFFIKLGGSASSEQIADWFRDKVPSRQIHLFRSLLRKVADFDANTRYWSLKPWAGGALPEGQAIQ